MFWKIFYALAAVFGAFYSIMYFAEVLPADNMRAIIERNGWTEVR